MDNNSSPGSPLPLGTSAARMNNNTAGGGSSGTQFTMKDRLFICFYEFLGTAMLVLGYNFTDATGMAVSFNLFVAIILAAKVSGAMFNPAVTVAIYITEGTFLKDL